MFFQSLLLKDFADSGLEAWARILSFGLDTSSLHLFLLRLLLQLESLLWVLFGKALNLLLEEAELLIVSCVA